MSFPIENFDFQMEPSQEEHFQQLEEVTDIILISMASKKVRFPVQDTTNEYH